MERLQELYEQLVDLIPEDQVDNYMACGCTVGENYDAMEKRLMIIERAPQNEPSDDCDPKACSTCSSCGSCSGIGNASLNGVNLNGRDFTGAAAHITHLFAEVPFHKWTDSVVRTYLYKVMPKKGRITREMMDKQKKLCEDILFEEIRAYNPTHVLFLTGWSGVWEFDFPLQPLLKGESVEAVGGFENGAYALVSRYVIRDSEDKFVSDIVAAFRTLDEANQ